jgi:hypothetical protein
MALEFRHTAMHKSGKNMTLIYHREVPGEVLQVRSLNAHCKRWECRREHSDWFPSHGFERDSNIQTQPSLPSQVVRSPVRMPKHTGKEWQPQ